MTKFTYMKLISLLLIILGFGYSITSFSNFYAYLFGDIIIANANTYIMATGLLFPLYTFIFGVFFYFYTDKYFAYIKDNDLNEFVGYVNYHYNKNDKRYECGILIDSQHRGKGYSKDALKLLCDEAKANGIIELYDNFEIDRYNTLSVFEQVGFEVVEEETWKKFGKDVKGVLVKIKL